MIDPEGKIESDSDSPSHDPRAHYEADCESEMQLSAQAIADAVNGTLVGPDLTVEAPATLADAGASTLSFVGDVTRFAAAFSGAMSEPGVILAPLATPLDDESPAALILVENPRAAFGKTVAEFFTRSVTPGIAETARIDATAQVHETAHIGEYTVIREGAVIGAHAEIRDHVVIGRRAVIGEHALIKSHAVIAEEGFGIEKDADGNNFHVPHIGSVRLGAHTEVGNFTTVCSGTIAPTVVGDYTKIDDHVHVAHNCQIGRNVIITACAEISGSVVLEDEVWIGPNASIIQGLTLGRDSLLGIGAVAVKSIPENEVRVGNPAKRLGDNKK